MHFGTAKCFAAWRAAAERRAEGRHRVASSLARLMHNMLARSFSTWQERTQRKIERSTKVWGQSCRAPCIRLAPVDPAGKCCRAARTATLLGAAAAEVGCWNCCTAVPQPGPILMSRCLQHRPPLFPAGVSECEAPAEQDGSSCLQYVARMGTDPCRTRCQAARLPGEAPEPYAGRSLQRLGRPRSKEARAAGWAAGGPAQADAQVEGCAAVHCCKTHRIPRHAIDDAPDASVSRLQCVRQKQEFASSCGRPLSCEKLSS